MINKELEKIGLSEKEAAVYLASLEVGEAQAPKIAQQAGTQRPITYVVLENLNKMGLVSLLDKKGKVYYVAENPSNLKRLIEKQKAQINQKEQIIREVMPNLEKIFMAMGDRPVVRFFEGFEGVKSVRELILKDRPKEVMSFYSLDAIFTLFPELESKFVNPERVKRKIKSRIIYTYSKGPIRRMNNKKELKESRYIDNQIFKLNGDVSIYKNKIALTSLYGASPVSVLVEDKGIASFMKDVFELAWLGAGNHSPY